MNIRKYMILGGMALGMGLTSCVGDLDLDPIDPNLESPTNPEVIVKEALECYQMMATSGQEGPGSSVISGLDNGRGQYTRAIFMMNEFPTDEVIWIWKDDGIYDLVTNTFDASNGNIYGTYARLFAHIAVCNQSIADTEGKTDPELLKLHDEVRTLRAMSYYWMLDIFGRSAFTISAPTGNDPVEYSRPELYKWLEGELVDIVDNGHLAETPLYGRVGKDAAEALLARLYLNAGVYTGTPAWDKCAARCSNIIARHQGGGFQGSGLAQEYLHLFCRDNKSYMPGGDNKAENEILWGIPFDADNLQSYGGTMFLINGALATGDGIKADDFGCNNPWKCMKAPQQFSERFDGNDTRWDLWLKGKVGEKEFAISNDEFSEWGSGYVCIKWTGLNRGNDYNPLKPFKANAREIFSSNVTATQFASTDLALIRLADVYLMYAECAMNGGADKATGVKYANYVRNRAGVPSWAIADLTPENLLNERSRELYWELTRRSDLIRFGKFTGPDQMVWAWKGNDVNGNHIAERYNLMPVPVNILAASPSFTQNPGY